MYAVVNIQHLWRGKEIKTTNQEISREKMHMQKKSMKIVVKTLSAKLDKMEQSDVFFACLPCFYLKWGGWIINFTSPFSVHKGKFSPAWHIFQDWVELEDKELEVMASWKIRQKIIMLQTIDHTLSHTHYLLEWCHQDVWHFTALHFKSWQVKRRNSNHDCSHHIDFGPEV